MGRAVPGSLAPDLSEWNLLVIFPGDFSLTNTPSKTYLCHIDDPECNRTPYQRYAMLGALLLEAALRKVSFSLSHVLASCGEVEIVAQGLETALGS